jgi:hypothetical protein
MASQSRSIIVQTGTEPAMASTAASGDWPDKGFPFSWILSAPLAYCFACVVIVEQCVPVPHLPKNGGSVKKKKKQPKNSGLKLQVHTIRFANAIQYIVLYSISISSRKAAES